MTLSDGTRHKLATAVALAAVLAAHYGLGADVVVAVALAAGIYAICLWLLAGHRTEAPVTTAEQDTWTAKGAIMALDAAADRVDRSARHVPGDDRRNLKYMAIVLRNIRDRVEEDPRDARATRRFIQVYLPIMLDSLEAYGRLTGQGQSDRLDVVGARIREYLPVLKQIEQACLENDLTELEAQVDALAVQLERRIG